MGFRNRAKMVITGSIDSPIVGLPGDLTNLDQGRELLGCPIHHPRLNAVIARLPHYIRTHRLTPYRIASRAGELKGVIAFHSPETRQTYIRFVLRSRECLPRLRALLPELQAEFPEVVCVSANLQPIPHAILEGPEEIFLTERKTLEHRIGPVTFRLAPQAFVQTNVEVATHLYETAAQWIQASGVARALELYCGQGAFSFFAAHLSPQLEMRGIEINSDAVTTANQTAQEAGLSRLGFEAISATDSSAVNARIAQFHPELILANPPRKGLTDAGVQQIVDALPPHFIYSSCAPDTLEKDLTEIAQRLSDPGRYQVKRAQLFDMFPHTGHFESLVWLERAD
jgi:23S rRNA (uracil747-C5)-methyltransferase